MPRGVPKPRKGAGLAAWRSRQKRGAIMKPATFARIKKRAAAGEARDPEKVAGAAYWATARKKYRNRKSREVPKRAA